jgi:O-6-methylguanine DNA methyltransferase
MLKINYGSTKSYSQIASEIGNSKATRAVGTACGKNPLPIIIPCHRVLAKNSIGGFSSGLVMKRFLLKLETN